MDKTNKTFKTRQLMRRLVTEVDPETYYPGSYTIKQDGTKVPESTQLLGKFLTENQIFELWQSGELSPKPLR